MSGLQTFDPDDLYCVHCHAPAAGMCAGCGALCCADCVELRMGWTRQRAVCRLCLADEPARPSARRWRPWALGLVAAGLAWVAWLWAA